MLADNPFSDLIPPSQPGIIYGPPETAKPVDPLDAESKRLENEIKRQRIAKGDPMGEGQAKLKESENTAGFLTTNVLTNVNILRDAIKADPSAAAPTWGQIAAGLAGEDVKNQVLPAQRQVVENAQRLIVDNLLTLGTGAAYTPAQIEAYRRGFFPQVGDTPEAIAAKQKSLRGAMLSARIKAGNAAPQIDAAMEALGLSSDPLAAPREGDIGFNTPDQPKNPLTPEQQAAYDAWIKVNPNADEAQLTSFFLSMGQQLDPARAKEMVEAARKGAGFAAGETAISGEAKEYRKAEDELSPIGPDGDVTTLLKSGASLNLSDEAAGVGAGIAGLLTGNNPIDRYRLGRDAERLRITDARNNLGAGGTALEIAGGFLSANPSAVITPATSALATIGQGAKMGAGVGALAGFGSGDGFSDSAEKAVVGGALGGLLGGTVSGVSTRLAPRGMAPELAAAADAENVRLIRPMVDPASRGKAGSLEATPGGQNIIRRGVENVRDDIEAGVEKLAADGTPLEPGPAGDRIQSAGMRFIQKSKGVADRLYTRARSLAGDAKIQPKEALAQADREIADLMQNPETNSAEIAFLQRIRGDLAQDGGKTVDALRSIRTTLRGAIDEAALTSSQAEARAARILDAAHQDAAAQLPSGAASAFRRADTYYRERMVHIDDVLDRFIGSNKAGESRLSGEAAFSKLKSMTSPGGDGRRLAAMWRNLEPSEQSDVAATIAQSLGRRAADEPFSTELFVSQARKLSPSARRTIFGPQGAESINNLVTLSRSLNEATRDFNRSNSGRTMIRAMGQTLAATLLGGGGGALAGGGGTAAAAAVGGAGLVAANAGRNALSARALMSPRVSRWLADVADVNTPARAQQLVNRLGTIIAREPALAGELTPLQQALSQQVRPAAFAESENEGKDQN